MITWNPKPYLIDEMTWLHSMVRMGQDGDILWWWCDTLAISYDDDGRTWRWQSMVDWNITMMLFTTSKTTWLQCQMPFRFSGYLWLFFPIFFTYACCPTKIYSAFCQIFTRKKGWFAPLVLSFFEIHLSSLSLSQNQSMSSFFWSSSFDKWSSSFGHEFDTWPLIGSDRSKKWTRSQDVSRLRLRLQIWTSHVASPAIQYFKSEFI